MSAALATRTQRRSGSTRAGRPQLRVLNQQAIRQRARRRNALLALFLIVLMGFFAVAFVHAQLVSGQRELDVLLSEIEQAETERARLSRAVEQASAPESVVNRAGELGMIRAAEPVYLAATVAAAPMTQVRLGPSTDDAVEQTPAPDLTPEMMAADSDEAGTTAELAVATNGSTNSAGAEGADANTGDAGEQAAPAPVTTAAPATPAPPVSTVAGRSVAVGGTTAGTKAVTGQRTEDRVDDSAGAATGAVATTDTGGASIGGTAVDAATAGTGSVGGGTSAGDAADAAPTSIAGSRAVAGGSGG